MFSYIKGELVEVSKDGWVVVENNQIGYQFQMSMASVEELPSLHEEIKVYTYLYIREDILKLFGFLTREELTLFQQLITVNGVGPKAALSILSELKIQPLKLAIFKEDAKAIAKAPGIGAKTASKIVLELKDKVEVNLLPTEGVEEDVSVINMEEDIKRDAMESLVALGYSQKEVYSVLKTIPMDENTTVEELLKNVLKKMAFI